MLIDTHAHVNFRSFKDDARETLQRALDNGIWVINVGSQIDTSRQAVELANQFSQGVYAVVGLHPEHTHTQYVDEEETHFLTREEKFDTDLYRELAKDPKVVGIGECGLDYYHIAHSMEHEAVKQIKEKQKAAFRAQVKLAKELDKVLVVHSRPAKGDETLYDDIIEILMKELPPSPSFEKRGSKNFPSPHEGREREGLRFEVHSFTGSPESLKKFLNLGAYVSFNGIITFDKTGNMEELVKTVPLDRIILETDCPYLTPVPNRGKRNEPSFVKFVAEKLAQIKNLSIEEVAEITTTNAKKLFKIPSP